MFDASQLQAYTACFRLPKKCSTGRSCEGNSVGLRSLTIPPVMVLKRLQAPVAPFPGLDKLPGPSFSGGMSWRLPRRPPSSVLLRVEAHVVEF